MSLPQLCLPLHSVTEHISSATHELSAYVPDKYGCFRNMVQNSKVSDTKKHAYTAVFFVKFFREIIVIHLYKQSKYEVSEITHLRTTEVRMIGKFVAPDKFQNLVVCCIVAKVVFGTSKKFIGNYMYTGIQRL